MPVPLVGVPILCPRCRRPVAYRRDDGMVVFEHKGLEGIVGAAARLRCPRNVAIATPDGRTDYVPCGGWVELADGADSAQ